MPVVAQEADASVVEVELLDSETARLVSWLSVGAMWEDDAVLSTSVYLAHRFSSWGPLQRRDEQVPTGRQVVMGHLGP